MSENLDLARRAVDAFNEGGIVAIIDDFHPEVEAIDLPQVPDARVRHGREGIRKWFAEMDEVWEQLRFEVEEFVEVDETKLVVAGKFRGRARDSGIEIGQSGAILLTVRDGKVIRWQNFPSGDEAIKAASEPAS